MKNVNTLFFLSKKILDLKKGTNEKKRRIKHPKKEWEIKEILKWKYIKGLFLTFLKKKFNRKKVLFFFQAHIHSFPKICLIFLRHITSFSVRCSFPFKNI